MPHDILLEWITSLSCLGWGALGPFRVRPLFWMTVLSNAPSERPKPASD